MLPCVGCDEGAVRVISASLSWPSGVGQQVVGIARAHDARAGQRERHARGVDSDPAAAPLLGDVGRRAGAAGGIEHEVAGVGRHEDAALRSLGQSAQHRPSVLHGSTSGVRPGRHEGEHSEVGKNRNDSS